MWNNHPYGNPANWPGAVDEEGNPLPDQSMMSSNIERDMRSNASGVGPSQTFPATG